MILIIISAFGAFVAFIAAYYARMAYLARREAIEPNYEIGFPEGNSVVKKKVVDIESDRMGQRVHFRVINRSRYPVKLPWCVVRFPTIFKHPAEDDPNSLTNNTTLGKVAFAVSDKGPILRISEDQPDVYTKIQGIISIDLFSPNDYEDFWVRFKLPDKPGEWPIEVRIDAVGTQSVTQQLILAGRYP